MRTIAVAVFAALAASCATPHTEPSLTPTQTSVAITTEEGVGAPTVRVTRDQYVSDDVLVGERIELWRLIPDAYTAVGLPLPTVDRTAYSARLENHVLSRSLGAERLSNFLECGNSIEGPHADTHRITLNVRTWIAPADSAGRSVVKSQVEASARNMMHGTSGTSHCSSRGRLEMLVREELRKLSVEQRLRGIRDRDFPSTEGA
jgi:hypothetical protein